MSDDERQSLGEIVKAFTRDPQLVDAEVSNIASEINEMTVSDVVPDTLIDPELTEVAAISNAVEMVNNRSISI